MSVFSDQLGGLEVGLPDFSAVKILSGENLRKVILEPSESIELSATLKPPALRRWLWTTVPSWLISTAVHVAVILILAAWNIEPITNELRMMLVSSESTSDSDELEEFSIAQSMTSELEETSEESPSDSPVVDSVIA